MLVEYALIPDVFDTVSYSSPAVCDVHLQNLKEVFLNESLVRDLYLGQWSVRHAAPGDRLHARGKELLRKLIQQRRLTSAPSHLPSCPETDHDWCVEALASHGGAPVRGIITTHGVKARFPSDPIVADVERISSAGWWQSRSPSLRVRRQTADYIACLGLVFSHANSLMFIDPHLDPTKHSYREFFRLLGAVRTGSPPLIEIHRVCYTGVGVNRTFPDWRSVFGSFSAQLRGAGLHAEVFIWDNFHDRYLITDIVGILIPNGFDISGNPDDLTTWNRLGRPQRDDVQREFDPAFRRHTVRDRFGIGK